MSFETLQALPWQPTEGRRCVQQLSEIHTPGHHGFCSFLLYDGNSCGLRYKFGWELSVFSVQFLYKPKTALKNEVYCLKNNLRQKKKKNPSLVAMWILSSCHLPKLPRMQGRGSWLVGILRKIYQSSCFMLQGWLKGQRISAKATVFSLYFAALGRAPGEATD